MTRAVRYWLAAEHGVTHVRTFGGWVPLSDWTPYGRDPGDLDCDWDLRTTGLYEVWQFLPCDARVAGVWEVRYREGTIPLCPACIGSIGGAHGGPDVPYRPADPGESCGAADHRGPTT